MSGALMLTAALCLVPAHAEEPELLWEANGFDNPESARFDPQRRRIYVSNVNGGPTDADGNGYLSMLSAEGRVVERHWVDGLDAPKGMALADDRLYVSDIDRLVVVDIDSASIEASYEATGAKFLNDVTVDGEGRVYVSDMLDDAIYRLDGTSFELWLRDAALDGPNGLLAESERLLVASWGEPGGGDATSPRLGRPLAVSWSDRSIQALSEEGLGHLDGLEAAVVRPPPADEDAPQAGSVAQGSTRAHGYVLTDWINGALLHWQEGGEGAHRLLDLPQGSADLGVIPEAGIVLVPLMRDGLVQAYRLEHSD